MKKYTLTEFSEVKNNLSKRFDGIIERIWDVSEIVEVTKDEYVREVKQLRVYFSEDALVDLGIVDDFEINEAYYDVISNEFVLTSDYEKAESSLKKFFK